MNYEKAKSYVSKTACTVLAAGAIAGLGCKSEQTRLLEEQTKRLETKIQAYETAEKTEQATYSAKNPEGRIAYIKEQLDAIASDGAITSGRRYESNEAKTVKLLGDRAKAIADNKIIAADLRTQAGELETKAKSYLQTFAQNGLKAFYVFVAKEGNDAYWYFLEPGTHAPIIGLGEKIKEKDAQGKETEVTVLDSMMKAFDFTLEQVMEKAQWTMREQFGYSPSRELTEVQLDAIKQSVFKNGIRIPRNRLPQMTKYFAEKKLTNGNLTIPADEYEEMEIIAGFIFPVPAENGAKVEKPKADTAEPEKQN